MGRWLFPHGAVSAGNSVDNTPPVVTSVTLAADGETLTVLFREKAAGHSGFTITPSGGAANLTYTSGDGTAREVFASDRTIDATETVTWDYTPGDIEDLAGNLMSADTGTVTNNSTQDVIAPTLSAASIDATGLVLTLAFDEAVTGSDAFTIDPSGGAATITYTAGTGTATLTFGISRAIAGSETVTLDYAAGDVADLASNALVTITDGAVTNNSLV